MPKAKELPLADIKATILKLRNRVPHDVTNVMDYATPKELKAIKDAVAYRESVGDDMIPLIKSGLIHYGMKF